MYKTLVIMAAGMGSRFGGLKQVEPVGPTGEFIIDYSIYDAIKAGFNKVVFIIKRENEELFKKTVGNRIEKKIKVEYVFQENTNIPSDIEIPSDRVKPLGTAHAILCCKGVVNEPFAIINADDFYGRDAYFVISKFLDKNLKDTYGLVGYKVKNTITENGSVKRGVCYSENGYLTRLIESCVEDKDGIITATPLENSEPFTITGDTSVSMNMFGFPREIIDYIETSLYDYLRLHKATIDKCEYLIADVVARQLAENSIKVELLSTTAKWQGITYREDKQKLVDEINQLIENGEYPKNLWNK